ncbi:MAG: protease modulator HflK [Pirellulales bacterium]|nr:protease modulator HflK [Pirellulales bacterium]
MNPKKTTPAVFQGLEAGLKMFRWVAVVLLALFAVSGIHEVGPDHVGLLLRFGRLHGATRADQIKEPGLLLALPYPMDRVVQVPAKQEGEIIVSEVWKSIEQTSGLNAIDPILEGYCLTGDQNIIQSKIVVKYRITNPIAFQLQTADPESILHDMVLAALTRSVAGWKVDDVLRLQRAKEESLDQTESLVRIVWNRAQERLDQLDCGMTISALEFKEVHPPRHVIAEFRAVQSAEIEMGTNRSEAEGYAAREIPKAEAERNRLVQQAVAYDSSLQARASEEMSVFEELYTEYQKSPALVANRIYLETMEHILRSVGRLNFVSPDERVILSDQEVQP